MIKQTVPGCVSTKTTAPPDANFAPLLKSMEPGRRQTVQCGFPATGQSDEQQLCRW